MRNSLHNISNKTRVNRFFSKKRSGQAVPSPKRNADASVRNLDPAPPQQTSSGHSAPPMPTGGLRYNLPKISYLQLYRAILQAVRSADYRPAWSKCATSAQDTAKDKVFVSHCRRRRKESLISWPAAQIWSCPERVDYYGRVAQA